MIDVSRPNVLLTGGSKGLGAGLAVRFLAMGAKVLVTGRDKEALAAMAKKHPGLMTFESDIGSPEDREALARHARDVLPRLNVVVNNAGIQRRTELAEDSAPWAERQREIDMLFSGPVHLNSLLIPTLLEASKAALHSYTVTLRHSLRDTPIRVVELIPPAVATSLAGPGNNHGAPVDDFCDTVFPMLVRGDSDDVGYGMTASEQFQAAQKPYRDMFASFAGRFSTVAYASRS